MTNNDAIEIIADFEKHIIPCDEYGYLIDSDLMEAHSMAVKALRNAWIPVTERLPNNNEHDWVLALVVEDNGFMHIPKVMEYRERLNDWYEDTYGWLSKHNGAFVVTHWMPLPEPPKED